MISNNSAPQLRARGHYSAAQTPLLAAAEHSPRTARAPSAVRHVLPLQERWPTLGRPYPSFLTHAARLVTREKALYQTAQPKPTAAEMSGRAFPEPILRRSDQLSEDKTNFPKR